MSKSTKYNYLISIIFCILSFDIPSSWGNLGRTGCASALAFHQPFGASCSTATNKDNNRRGGISRHGSILSQQLHSNGGTTPWCGQPRQRRQGLCLPITATTTRGVHSGDDDGSVGEDDEPDLFDYFDPLLSPHAYPEGISPKKKPAISQSSSNNSNEIPHQQQQQLQRPQQGDSERGGAGFSVPFGINYLAQVAKNDDLAETGQEQGKSLASTGSSSSSSDTGKDLFEYFDPLLSPHSYPGGVSPAAKPKELQKVVVEKSTTTGGAVGAVVASSSPTTPNTIEEGTGNKQRRGKIGILLMDHGSRNAASNARLGALADLYQLTLTMPEPGGSEDNRDGPDDELSNSSSCEFVVEAAHMEIASPSIPDGLRALLQAGVDEIVCHPYFLSPGRHVREDIPTIVNDAIETLGITIPVTTTAPVGSNTQLMLGAIHASVRENSLLLSGYRRRAGGGNQAKPL